MIKIEELNIFYIYVLICPITNQVRYIGKGSKSRAFNVYSRTGHCKSWIKNLKNNNLTPIVKIVKSNLTEPRAFYLEKLLIKFCKYFKFNLTNLTLGGDGPAGYEHNEKAINKMSKTYFKKGGIPWNKGLKQDDNFKLKVKEGRRLGKKPKVTDEVKRKRHEILKQYNFKKRCKVIGIHKLTKETIEFASMTDAQKSGFVQSEISFCCKNPNKTHYGYFWRKL